MRTKYVCKGASCGSRTIEAFSADHAAEIYAEREYDDEPFGALYVSVVDPSGRESFYDVEVEHTPEFTARLRSAP